MAETIDRGASDATKGFRLQKLRAINLMLDLYNLGQATTFYSAVEYTEDVYLAYADRDCSEEYFEEDKNYDAETGFSLNSHEVKNSLVSFFDIYLSKWEASETLSLAFHSTNKIAKERKTQAISESEIQLPDRPILELLIERKFDEPNLISAIRFVLEKEYESQYAHKTNKGKLDELKKMQEGEFLNFLRKISWSFGNGDQHAEQLEVISKIRASKAFDYRLEGKERAVLALLSDMMDEKQGLPNLNDRFLYKSDIELVFLQAAGEPSDLSLDPAWERWDELESSGDERNLQEKVLAVFADCPPKVIKSLSFKAATAKLEEGKFAKSYRSMKYRVYDASLDYMVREDIPSVIDKKALFHHLDAMHEKCILIP